MTGLLEAVLAEVAGAVLAAFAVHLARITARRLAARLGRLRAAG